MGVFVFMRKHDTPKTVYESVTVKANNRQHARQGLVGQLSRDCVNGGSDCDCKWCEMRVAVESGMFHLWDIDMDDGEFQVIVTEDGGMENEMSNL